jgi:hypothetical protein
LFSVPSRNRACHSPCLSSARVYKIILPPRSLYSRCPVSIAAPSHIVQAMCYFNVSGFASQQKKEIIPLSVQA